MVLRNFCTYALFFISKSLPYIIGVGVKMVHESGRLACQAPALNFSTQARENGPVFLDSGENLQKHSLSGKLQYVNLSIIIVEGGLRQENLKYVKQHMYKSCEVS